MNPANFPAGMPGAAKPHGQVPVMQKNENTQLVMNQVAQMLQAQGPFSGWRAEVSIKERAMKIYQMYVYGGIPRFPGSPRSLGLGLRFSGKPATPRIKKTVQIFLFRLLCLG